MEINNAFEVKAPIDVAWATLTDLERIAPCLPGATLTSIEGDIYKGHVTIKVGPIVAKPRLFPAQKSSGNTEQPRS